MTIKIQFIILRKLGITDLKKDRLFTHKEIFAVQYAKFVQLIDDIAYVKIVDIHIVNPVKELIMNMILETCVYKKARIIIIMGNVNYRESHEANKAIKAVSANRKELPTELGNLLTSIEERLEKITNYRIKCGIYDQIIIINLSGPYEDKRRVFKDISYTVLTMLHSILDSENRRISDSSDNDLSEEEEEIENFEEHSSPVAPLHSSKKKSMDANENLEEQSSSIAPPHSSKEEDMDTIENLEKQFSPIALSYSSEEEDMDTNGNLEEQSSSVAPLHSSKKKSMDANENLEEQSSSITPPHSSKEEDMDTIENLEKQFSPIALSYSSEEEDMDTNGNLEEQSSSVAPPHSSETDNASMESFTKLISIENAIKILNKVAHDDENERKSVSVKISDAYGKISMENVYSKCNVPSFRTSSKHGYAVLVNDGKGVRKVVEPKTNNSSNVSLKSGKCVWVNSGAPIPKETTAVVEVKDTRPLENSPNDDSRKYIKIMIEPKHEQNIKTVGYEVKENRLIVYKFRPIGSEEMGLLALCGRKEILVAKQLSIGVLSIGDNLKEPGESLTPGFIYDINRITLISLLKHHGYSSLDLGIASNRIMSIYMKLDKAFKEVDILVTTGSINDKDLLKNILTEYFGAKIHFGNVNIKPGKSTTLATCKMHGKTKYLLCLSGNPTSAFITAHLFLLPFIDKLNRNLYTFPAEVPVEIEGLYFLHHRPRLAWTSLHWPACEKIAKASNLCNLYPDKLCNIMGSSAILTLSERKKKMEILPATSIIPALFVDDPRNVVRQLI